MTTAEKKEEPRSSVEQPEKLIKVDSSVKK